MVKKNHRISVSGSYAKCPICGVRNACWDGLRVGSTTSCEHCEIPLTVTGTESVPKYHDTMPVFTATVSVTPGQLKMLQVCSALPVTAANRREERTLEALKGKGLVEHFGAFGFMTKSDIAQELPRSEVRP